MELLRGILKTAVEDKKQPPSKTLGPYQENGEWFGACGDGKVLRLLQVEQTSEQ